MTTTSTTYDANFYRFHTTSDLRGLVIHAIEMLAGYALERPLEGKARSMVVEIGRTAADELAVRLDAAMADSYNAVDDW